MQQQHYQILEKKDVSFFFSSPPSFSSFLRKISNDADSIEEKGGARYNKKIDLLLGDWKAFSWKLSDFTLADDSRDDNGKLDADQIKQISIADVTNLMGGSEAEETHLWVDNVIFTLSP